MTEGPTPSITTSAWPSSSDITPVIRSITTRCSGVDSTSSRLTSVGATDHVPDPLDRLADHRGDLGGVEVDGAEELLDLAVDVVLHPGHRGELHAVGLLVQADPEPEVGPVDTELVLGMHDVGCHQQQPAGRRRMVGADPRTRVERVELSEHLRRQEAEEPPDLQPADLRADRLGDAVRSATLGLQLLDEGADDLGEPVGVGLDPADPVHDQHGRGAPLGGQPGEVLHQLGRAVRVRLELGDDGVRVGPGDGGAWPGEPRGGGDARGPSRSWCFLA